MAKWSNEKMADLTRKLADTAIDYKKRCEELEAKLAQQDSLWEAFKHWDGERKYALRIIVKHLKNTPGSDAEGSCAPQADGSGEDS